VAYQGEGKGWRPSKTIPTGVNSDEKSDEAREIRKMEALGKRKELKEKVGM